jgi:cytochrome b subunit of formate dehydrogenase
MIRNWWKMTKKSNKWSNQLSQRWYNEVENDETK